MFDQKLGFLKIHTQQIHVELNLTFFSDEGDSQAVVL